MANSEKTLVLVKPDGVSEGHIGEVITRLERKGYQIAALKVIKATAEQLQQHYSEKVGKPYFKEIETYMMEGPLVAIIVSGTGVVKAVHRLAGSTRPAEAQPGTIRGISLMNIQTVFYEMLSIPQIAVKMRITKLQFGSRISR